MLNSFLSRNTCEAEAKFVQDRIQFVEKNVADFCNAFAEYSRKAARVRDKGDEIAKIILQYAESENINKSLVMGLGHLSESLSNISDYGDIRVQALDTKVVSGLAQYDIICKHAREEVKNIYSAREKEMNRKRQLDKIRERNPRNRQQIIQAETELVKATAEVTKTIHNLEDKTNQFERQKLHNLKSIFLDFITIEIGYHAKTLEILTKAYNDIDSINEKSDFEDFKKSLRMQETVRRQSERKASVSRSTGSLGSLGAIFSTSSKKATATPNTKQKQRRNSGENLESVKSLSDSEESESENEENSEDATSSERKETTAIRKFRT